MADPRSLNSTKQVMDPELRLILICWKPGWALNRARSSPSFTASLRLPINSVLHGGLSRVLVMGA